MKIETKEVERGQSFSIDRELQIMRNCMTVHNRAESIIINYSRSLRKVYDFFKINPRELEIDQVIDYLVNLKKDQEMNWRTIKLYVAGLRYYYGEIVE